MTTGRLDRRVTLHAMMNEYFNASEMSDLYHECGLNYNDESGDKSNKIWRLIDYFAKRERQLAAKCEKERPGIDWPFL